MKNFILLLSVIFICSCTFLSKNFERTILIESNPTDAIVYVMSLEKNEFLEIGKTPLTLSFKENLPKELKDTKTLVLLIEKRGFVSQNIVIDSSVQRSVSINLTLKSIENWNDPTNKNSSIFVNDVGRRIQAIYRYIRTGEIEAAMANIDTLIGSYPDAAIFYDIKGSLNMLSGDNQAAIAQFERSLQLRPDNVETLKVLDELKTGKRVISPSMQKKSNQKSSIKKRKKSNRTR